VELETITIELEDKSSIEFDKQVRFIASFFHLNDPNTNEFVEKMRGIYKKDPPPPPPPKKKTPIKRSKKTKNEAPSVLLPPTDTKSEPVITRAKLRITPTDDSSEPQVATEPATDDEKKLDSSDDDNVPKRKKKAPVVVESDASDE
jgi:hypothetical protein